MNAAKQVAELGDLVAASVKKTCSPLVARDITAKIKSRCVIFESLSKVNQQKKLSVLKTFDIHSLNIRDILKALDVNCEIPETVLTDEIRKKLSVVKDTYTT